ncbi:MAG: hypothetical protein ACR2IE_15435 [Candidatus Sumerlaeaceae bacterium]
MTKPIEELQKIALALQSVVGNRAEIELFQDPATHTTLLKVEQESQFAARVILKTSDIRQMPITLVSLLPGDPEAVTCETPTDLDEALANFVASAGMHELLKAIMAG